MINLLRLLNASSMLYPIIINKQMYKQRKKVMYEVNKTRRVVVVDSDTDELQEQAKQPTNINSRKNIKNFSGSQQNLYEQINFIPQIQLSKDDMKQDPIQLFMKLQQKYKEYGAVKLKACSEWEPPLCFKYTQKGITTRIQKIHRLTQGKAFHQNFQEYNIRTFTHMAEEFEKSYKFKFDQEGATKQGQLENEYWKLVKGDHPQDIKNPDKYKVTVEYAADLPVHQYGSGFPLHQTLRMTDQNFNYASSYFNLNNMYKSPSSILKISQQNKQKISGITIPWVYMGMRFSSFCWHVEDLWLNSLNYSHKGAIKTWYVIPESHKEVFDDYVLKKTGKREFLNSITFMIDPLELKKNGIKVYKAYQKPREYILTLFGAYHAGFSQGWNIGEAVNVGTVDCLQAIKKAMKAAYSFKNHKPPVLCFEWLIHGNLNNPNINCQQIKKQYNKIVSTEYCYLQRLTKIFKITQVQWVNPEQKYDKMICHTCRHYQYLSVIKCTNCQQKYCLEHVHKCCGKTFILITREPDLSRKKAIDLVLKRE